MFERSSLSHAAFAAVLSAGLIAPIALADAPSTQPSEEKENEGDSGRLSGILSKMKEAVEAEPTTKPSGDEAAEATANLTPGELIKQMREKADAEKAMPLVAQIDLSVPLSERPVGFSLFGGGGMDLRSVLGRLDAAEKDPEVKAVLLTFFNGGMMNLSQAQEIRDKLDALRRAGKRTFAYADTYDTTSYLVASACTDVVLMDGGEMFMPGIAIEPMFYRGALDKLGVKPDYVQVGEYKGAEEPYTRSTPSPELTKEMEKLVESMYSQVIDEISGGRSMAKSKVEEAIDRAMTPAGQALQQGFVDHLADADGLRELFEEELGAEPRINAAYATGDAPSFDPDNPFAIFQLLKPQNIDADKPSVAIVYAQGAIVDGTGGAGGLLGGGDSVNTEYIRRAMRLAARDDEVKAVVLRIDSPGGSALASEAMYQAIKRVAEDKPVIVSIGGIAASGGYYIAVAGDEIYADPAAIIGSIGVVGGKLVLDGLYEKVGLSTTMFKRGENAGLFSQTEPWDDRQRRLVRNWMKSTYDQFTDRVATGRGDAVADVDDIARGRIFLAEEGKKLGMVDHLGGIDDALAAAAKRADLGDDYEVIVLPGEQSNPFAGAGGGFPLGSAVSPLNELMRLLPAGIRDNVGRLIVTSELLEDRPVILMMPYAVRIR